MRKQHRQAAPASGAQQLEGGRQQRAARVRAAGAKGHKVLQVEEAAGDGVGNVPGQQRRRRAQQQPQGMAQGLPVGQASRAAWAGTCVVTVFDTGTGTPCWPGWRAAWTGTSMREIHY